MKRISIDKLWRMVSRIDSTKKALIAENFVRECDLSNDDFDELMMSISNLYRLFSKLERA